MPKLKKIKYCLDDFALAPLRAHDEDAGLDLRSPVDCTVPAHGSLVIDTGVHLGIPKGYAGVVQSKSGLNIKHDIIALGLIDAGYAGPVVIKLYNLGDNDYSFARGDKITQVVIQPISTPKPMQVELVNKLYKFKSKRGSDGFGSSGK